MRFNVLHTFKTFLERSLAPKLGISLGGVLQAGTGLFTGNPALIASGVGSLLTGSGAEDIARQQAAGSIFNPVDINTGAGGTSFISAADVEQAMKELEAGAQVTTGSTEDYYDFDAGEWVQGDAGRVTIGDPLTAERRAALEQIIAQGEGFHSQLSPELQALRDQQIQIAQGALGDFQTFDPNEAGKLFTAKLDELAAPKEEQQRLQLENRLFKQGLLSSSSGADATKAILEAQDQTGLKRELTGMEFGQSQQQRLFQNALNAISGGTSLDTMSANQLSQAINAASGNTTASTNAARIIAGGETQSLNQTQDFFNLLTQRLPTSGLFGTPDLNAPVDRSFFPS